MTPSNATSPPTNARFSDGRTRLLSFVADAAAVVVFVALGRDAHSEGSAVGGTLTVAAPFLIALAASWVVVLATIQRTPNASHLLPTATGFGVPVWVGAVALGMLLRHTAFNKGTAFSFIIVATVFLGLLLVGWRAIFNWRRRRKA